MAAWYWQQNGLNTLADRGDVRGITRRVNGGLNHLTERQNYYNQFLDQLQQAPATTPQPPILMVP